MTAIEIRALRRDEVSAWVAHCMHVFKHTDAMYFESHLHDDAAALIDMRNILVAVDTDDAICASVRVVPRHQFVGGRVVSMGGIAEVSTKEAHRGKGLASRLLRAAIAGPLASFDLSVLHTNFARLGRFYGQHGWQSVEFKNVRVQLSRPPSSSLPPSISIAPLDIHAYADEILALYHTVSADFNGPLLRTVPYVQEWIAARHRRNHMHAVGAWNGPRLVAYIFGKAVVEAETSPAAPGDDTIVLHVDELIVPGRRSLGSPPLADDDRAVVAHHLLAHLASSSTAASMDAILPLPVAINLSLVATPDPLITVDRGWMFRNVASFVDAKLNVMWDTDGF
ncbi:Aste57867_20085 [Aphanomyces stellatus]|uniref:Aste57867_20085 protein n=1 Tax=Aphanomyces stellatus TaxID=120398 RepID=A0A485LEV1_9STRA|nr:hypothetical protein As57867_020019 [Aphanomyces stellatus]VFT96780.1 Aste57867_20085 [Aphanomyces stellatus]